MTYRPTSVTIGDATYLPVPDGMTLADAEAALADAGAWVGVVDPAHCPDGARMMNRWTNGLGGDDLYVHRDDLPPTDPDAELVEKMARAARAARASLRPARRIPSLTSAQSPPSWVSHAARAIFSTSSASGSVGGRSSRWT